MVFISQFVPMVTLGVPIMLILFLNFTGLYNLSSYTTHVTFPTWYPRIRGTRQRQLCQVWSQHSDGQNISVQFKRFLQRVRHFRATNIFISFITLLHMMSLSTIHCFTILIKNISLRVLRKPKALCPSECLLLNLHSFSYL